VAGLYDRLLIMGRIGAPFGVKGWLKIHSETAPPENLLGYSPWWIKRREGWSEIRVVEGRRHGKALVAHFEGIDDRDAARELVGSEIAVRREQLEPPEEGHYYWADLIGAEVINRKGIRLGCVDHLIDTGANDVLVVTGDRERLIPFVLDRYVERVDLEGGRIDVDWDERD
jgi:16S rRNA processing protein RimM